MIFDKVFCSKESQVQDDIFGEGRRESMLCPMPTSGLEFGVLRLLVVRLQKLRVAVFIIIMCFSEFQR